MHRLRINLRVKYMPFYRYYVYLAIDPMHEYLLPSFLMLRYIIYPFQFEFLVNLLTIQI